MPIAFSRLATAKALAGGTQTLLFTGTAAHTYSVKLYICMSGLSSGYITDGDYISLWAAANSWASGVPSGSTLSGTWLQRSPFPGNAGLYGPYILSGNEKIVVGHTIVNATGALMDVIVYGTDYS